MDLKERLINTGYFLDNIWLNKYVNLIKAGSINRTDVYSERHHIIPFCYFADKLNAKTAKEKDKLRKLSSKLNTIEYNLITKNNIICLSFYQHCLAHYYLFKCMNSKFSYYNEIAFTKMTDRKIDLSTCSEHEIRELIQIKINLLNDPTSKIYLSNQINKIILKNYPNGGYKLCQELIKKHFNLEFTKARIKARALQLHIHSNKYLPPWTKEDEQVLKNYYEKFGYKKCLELLPNKTKTSIQAKAKQLNLVAPGASKKNAGWNKEEDDIIVKFYPSGGATLCKKYLPNRTLSAIKARANGYLKIYKEK